MFWSAFFFTSNLPKKKKTPRWRRYNDKLNTFFMLLSEQLKMHRTEYEYVKKRHESAFDDLRDYKISPTLHITQDLLEKEVRKWYEKKNRTTEIVDRLENLLNTFGDF